MSENGAVIALLGRKDEPTDAVQEYCEYLGSALQPHGFALTLDRVGWAEVGWPAALRELRKKAQTWRGKWVLLQYTALAWSARGFPLRFLRVINILRRANVRVAVVYHDAGTYAGTRLIDKLRRKVQLHTMRSALRRCDFAVLTIPAEKIPWLPHDARNTVFIPVGPNLPVPQVAVKRERNSTHAPTVAVFGITGGAAGTEETSLIVDAIRRATEKIGHLRLLVFGRNSETAENSLRKNLRNVPVELSVLGLLPAQEVARAMFDSDVLFFVRGAISSRRGSAIAGIACGLPVIAYEGSETAPPITDAGVVLVPRENTQEFDEKLGASLITVLSDDAYRESLAERSRTVYDKYFAWPAIAARYAEAFRKNK